MKHHWGICFLFILVLLLVGVGQKPKETAASPTSTEVITLISVDSSGAQGNDWSDDSVISANGRFVAFRSPAPNLVSDDTNNSIDIFVHDRETETTTRVSVNSSGTQANHGSYRPTISANGRFVSFHSDASNFVPNDTNGMWDIFVHDRETGTTNRVSVDSSGFQANGESGLPVLSEEGRFVAFQSIASNLVLDDTNNSVDIFVHDRETGSTTRISVDSSGVQGNNESLYPTISDDGRYVAFFSRATNLDPSDTNGTGDIFVHDRQTGTTTRVSVDSSGVQANNMSHSPTLSADGRFLAFESYASNLVLGDTNGSKDVFIHDLQTKSTTRVSVSSSGLQGNEESVVPALSADGRFVAFQSRATNLSSNDTNGDPDIFIHDRETGTTTRVSVDSSGLQGNDASEKPSISADGRFVAFNSYATNLVVGDINNAQDIFVHDQQARASQFSVSGRVNDQVNTPVSDVTVCVQSGPCASTNSSGIYNITGLAAGNYTIIAAKSGFAFSPVSLQATVPPDATHLDFTALPVASSISGRVTSTANETPISGVIVVLNENVTVQTDTNGNYTFNDVLPGEHTITVPGYSTTPPSRSMTVPPDATDQDFVATPILSSVSGHVYHSVTSLPIAGATVSADGTSTTVTDINGEYILTGLAPGTHIVAAAKPGMEFIPTSRSITLPPDASDVDFSGTVAGAISDTTTRVSVASDGTEANQEPNAIGGVTADGKYVLFSSHASNLVPEDTQLCGSLNCLDVFLHDGETGETTMLSVILSGVQANGNSDASSMSSDGRFIVINSEASNLVDDDTNGYRDTFVLNRQTGQFTRVSVSSDGAQGNNRSGAGLVSDDGRYVVFYSLASNLVAGDAGNDWDVFLRDIQNGTTTRLSLGLEGQEPDDDVYPAAMTGDAHYMVLNSAASNLVPGDTNETWDVFVLDQQGGITRVSVGSDGSQADGESNANPGSISADGRYIAFGSYARNLAPTVVDGHNVEGSAYVHDRLTGETEMVILSSNGIPSEKEPGGDGFPVSISADGRFVAFLSWAPNLVFGDTNQTYDIFVRDRMRGMTTRASVASDGTEAWAEISRPLMAADGCSVVFDSDSNLLVPDDNNNEFDVFVRTLLNFCDNDQDSIPEATEAAAPNNGDGNNDGTPDSQQANVASLPNSGNGEYVTLATPDGTELTGVAAIDNPAPGTEPEGAEFPAGFLEFGIDGLANGTAVEVEIFLEGGVTAETYYKYGPTSGNPTDHWYEFLYDGTTGAEILPDKIVLHFVDGQRGDGDLTADGVITDPGAPAHVTPPLPPAIYLSPTGTATVGPTTARRPFTNADILSYVKATHTWDILYDGSYVKTTKNVDAFAFDGDDILLSFAAGQAVTGLGTFAPQDIARFTPTALGYLNTAGAFAWEFDGSDVGLTTSGENIDALWVDAAGRFYISTTGSGEVPVNSAMPAGVKFKFQDEDVLRFTPTSLGATTAGTWEMYWDTTGISGMGVEDIGGYWEDPTTGDRFVTLPGSFNVGNVAYGGKFAGNGKTVLRFTPNTAAPGGWAPAEKVVWLAAGATFPSNLDGIEMGR